MAHTPAPKRAQNGQRTITLPIFEEQYAEIINDPKRFREEWLDPHIPKLLYADCPELFPPGFDKGYEMKDRTHSQRLHLDIRRITLRNGLAYSVRPSFALPMMVGRVGEFANALFLRKFGVPLWALERVFGINATKLYRLELSIGRNSIVGTTVKTKDVSTHLLADEHHEKRCGEKVYIATTVAEAANRNG